MEWECIRENNWLVYLTEKTFDKDKYQLRITIEESKKNTRYWVSLSSGRKRKDLDIFEEKLKKSSGGIQALFWARNAIEDFESTHHFTGKSYLVVAWSDVRRKKIYEKYLKGFQINRIDDSFVLIKQIRNKNGK